MEVLWRSQCVDPNVKNLWRGGRVQVLLIPT